MDFIKELTKKGLRVEVKCKGIYEIFMPNDNLPFITVYFIDEPFLVENEKKELNKKEKKMLKFVKKLLKKLKKEKDREKLIFVKIGGEDEVQEN